MGKNEVADFSSECMKRCPELHACVAELALRQMDTPEITLQTVIHEHQESGTLPAKCSGPTKGGAGRSSVGHYTDIAQATAVKVDAWGDSVTVRCRSQGDIGGGKILSIQ